MSDVNVLPNTANEGFTGSVGLVPEGWSLKRFEDITNNIKSGLSRRIVAQDIGIPVLISGNIKNNRLDLTALKYWYVNDPQGSDTSKYVLKNGDILLCFINSLSQIGKVCLFKDIGRQAIYTTNLFRITTLPDYAPEFIYQLMTYETFKEEIALITKPAVNQASFTKTDLVEIPLLIPPKLERDKIAKILTSVDEVIEKTQAQIDKLKNLKTGMMQELLTKGIGHTEFKDSPVGSIPVGWDAVSIGHLLSSNIIASVQDGNHGEKHPKSADFVPVGIPFVMASDIHDQEIDVEGSNKITEEIYNGLRIGFSVAGDVLLSHKATVGLTAVVPENIKRIMLTPQVTYYRISDQSKLYNWYLHYCFQSGYFQERLSILSAQSTRSYIGIKAQADMLIALPSYLTEQKKIVDVLKSLDSKIRLIKTKVNVLKDTKKALMQDLLTGKVRVNTAQATPKVTVD
jgi:type I restriction enzyme S subunit